MSLLSNLKSAGLEEQEDRLGGFSLKKTDIYPATIKLAYITKSAKGALAVNLIFNINGQEYRENPIYITNANGENFYYTKDANGNRTDKKAQLPGFNLVNNICRLAIDKELEELDTEDKTIKVYDPEERKELPKSLPCITALNGAEIYLAIVEQTVNKREKNDDGSYTEIADSRDENFIEHAFHAPTQLTVNEIKAGKAEPDFYKQWLEKWKDVKRDKRSIKDGAAGAPKSGRPSTAGGAPQGGQTKTSSLFNRG